jgi:hypothetical protein
VPTSRRISAVAAVVVLASALAGCGGDKTDSGSGTTGSSGDYCATIQSIKDDVSNGSLDNLSQADFDQLRDKVGDLEASAPADVADDWQSLGDYLGQFDSLLSDAGISLDDLQSLQSGDLPPGVDTATITRLATKLSALGTSTNIDAADKAISASAKKDCDIDLDGGGASPASEGPAS